MSSKLSRIIFGEPTASEHVWQIIILLLNIAIFAYLMSFMQKPGLGVPAFSVLILGATLLLNAVLAILLWVSKIRVLCAFQPILLLLGAVIGIFSVFGVLVGGYGEYQNSTQAKESAVLSASYPPVSYSIVNLSPQTISIENEPDYSRSEFFLQILPFFSIEPSPAAQGGGFVYLDSLHTINLYDRARWIDTDSAKALDICIVDQQKQCQFKTLPIRRLATPKFDSYAKLRIAAGEPAATAGEARLPTIQYVYYVYPDRIDVLAADFTWQDTPFPYPSTPFRIGNASKTAITQVRVDDFTLPENIQYPVGDAHVLNYYGRLPKQVQVSWISKAAPLLRFRAIIDVPAGVGPSGLVLDIHEDHIRLRNDILQGQS